MLNKQVREKIRIQLIKLCDELETDIELAKGATAPVTLDQQSVGRVSRIDALQNQQLRQQTLQRQKQQLNLARQALARVDSEDFGICLECEEAIEPRRLLIKPESLLCMKCTQKNE